MEMNTRLQVEHPVTEEITGAGSGRVAAARRVGRAAAEAQDELAIDGQAIEARLYAEDPAKGFLPSVGRLEHFDLGDDDGPRSKPGSRRAMRSRPIYDPMIAKLIARGDDRAEAIAGLADILDEVEVWPVRTNAGFLFNALLQPDFAGRPRSTPASSSAISTSWCRRRRARRCDVARRRCRGDARCSTTRSRSADLAGFRLNAPAHRRASRSAVTASSARRLDDEQPMAAVSGFRDDERVVVFYEGQATTSSR